MIVRDARGSLVHVRDAKTGECVGCVEVGLFEIVRDLILRERYTADDDEMEVTSTAAVQTVIVAPSARSVKRSAQ